MDSLLATYASSDEEEVEEEQSHHQQKQSPSLSSDLHPNPKSSALSSLPPPKSTFLSLPPPKSQTLKTSSLFSVLPQPKAQNPNPQIPSNPKKVVQFRPPINPSIIKSINSDDEEDEEDEKEKQKKRAKALESMNAMPTVKSFLSNIPAPKNSMTLGALPSSSGSGRKSILEASSNSVNSNTSRPSLELDKAVDDASNWNSVSENNVNYCDNAAIDASNLGSVSEGYANYNSSGGSASENYANYGSYDVGYGEYGNSYEYESKWIDRSGTTEMHIAPAAESVMRGSGKRGRNDVVPQDIIEVKQDELMKNRPREDQSKLTGIAFGPSYQPVSTKGKPSKLHKRKHQIGTLYYDMKNKDMELSERRARGFLTKAETQAKYGW